MQLCIISVGVNGGRVYKRALLTRYDARFRGWWRSSVACFGHRFGAQGSLCRLVGWYGCSDIVWSSVEFGPSRGKTVPVQYESLRTGFAHFSITPSVVLVLRWFPPSSVSRVSSIFLANQFGSVGIGKRQSSKKSLHVMF